jgi:TRAP-type C4-dicarboxylate transport system substrate-binding protein
MTTPRPVRWLAFGAVLVLCGAAGPLTPTWTLKIATLAPHGTVWFNELAQAASDWKRASQGRAAMTVYWGGTQGDDEAVIRRIRLGQLQGGWLTVVGLIRIDDGFRALNMPLFYDSTDELFCVMDRVMPVLASRVKPKGFIVLSPGYAGWVQMFTTRPAATADALKELRIWTSVGDEQMVRWYKQNGFRPVALTATDLTAALLQRRIEALPVTPLTALSMQYYARAPHMLQIDLAPLPGALLLATEAWQRLPGEVQASLTAAAAASWSRMRVSVPDAERRAVDAMRRHQKFTVTRVKGTPAGASFDDLARRYASSLRGDWVPADIYDLAVSRRDACRAKQ